MARDWASQFEIWARGPGKTEQEKMERAETAITTAIAKSAKLRAHDVVVRAQGSYYNHTNVPGESDVDVRAVVTDVFRTDWTRVDPRVATDREVEERLDRSMGWTKVSYGVRELKDDVGVALVDHFGPPPAVIRGNKAHDIHENTYRVESDCLAAMENRLLYRDPYGTVKWASGVYFVADDGEMVQNYPEQQHDENNAKHDRTGRRFRKAVRVLKNLRNEMKANGVAAADPIASFLSECLVWNVSDARFHGADVKTYFRSVLASLYVDLDDPDKEANWMEENNIKPLFATGQPWTRMQARDFVAAAFAYIKE